MRLSQKKNTRKNQKNGIAGHLKISWHLTDVLLIVIGHFSQMVLNDPVRFLNINTSMATMAMSTIYSGHRFFLKRWICNNDLLGYSIHTCLYTHIDTW